MIGWINNRLRSQDEGFTLVELMVVVLVISILIAIAIPTFLGARERAQDRAAQSDLRNGLVAAKVDYVDNEVYATGNLGAIEPSLTFGAMPAASTTVIGVLVEHVTGTDAQIITLTRQSVAGDWFCVSDTATGGGAGTAFGSAATLAAANATADCTADAW